MNMKRFCLQQILSYAVKHRNFIYLYSYTRKIFLIFFYCISEIFKLQINRKLIICKKKNNSFSKDFLIQTSYLLKLKRWHIVVQDVQDNFETRTIVAGSQDQLTAMEIQMIVLIHRQVTVITMMMTMMMIMLKI